jgi:CheY-like chemotaxis protein
MDLRMPIMDGLEATRRIRQLNRPDATTVPILALTANAFEGDVQSSLDAGMNVHLAKPVNADRLYAELRHLVAQARVKEAGGIT